MGDGGVALCLGDTTLFQDTFTDAKEALFAGLQKSLELKILILTVTQFSSSINQQLDVAYGKSFKNKFEYATLPIDEFIQIMLEKLPSQQGFLNKLTTLLSPFHKIEHNKGLKIKLTQEFGITQHIKVNASTFKSDKFVKPEISFFTDASVSNKTFLAGYGISNRDIKVSFRHEDKTNDNNIAELKAIQNAVIIAKEMNVSSLEIFTDSDPSICFLNKNQKHPQNVKPEFKVILDDIFHHLKSFDGYHIAWIPRNKNKFADCMSKVDFPNNLVEFKV
jgi:ribonuclease HI